ncbi:MAG: hypothetical protein ING41_05320 [Burkholderiales bacterium]|nr:hypothetical protein [Burkholderiales bacterium]
MRRRRLLALGLACALALPRGARTQEIEVLALRHRNADELLPLLRPFVEPGGALTGQGFQLILRTGPANRAQIHQLLASLDRPPRQLLVAVRQDRAVEEERRGLAADGSVIVGTQGAGGSVRVQGGNERSLATQDATQTIRVTEGGRAWIAMGTAVPLTFRRLATTPQGLTEVVGTVYYEAVTGFFVRPQLAGEQVTLDLEPEQGSATVRGLERSALSTRVQGRLGEWIAVGGADVREDRSASGLLSSERGVERNRRGVWLKVDALP